MGVGVWVEGIVCILFIHVVCFVCECSYHVYFVCTLVCCALAFPVHSFEELRDKLRCVCRDAEEKEAAWRIVAADNARQRLILEQQ